MSLNVLSNSLEGLQFYQGISLKAVERLEILF